MEYRANFLREIITGEIFEEIAEIIHKESPKE